MSTQVREQQGLTFAAAEAADMPKLVCVGFVEGVGEGKVSSSGKYIVQPITLAPYGSGRGITVQFLYRPEWMTPGFDPNSIKNEVEDEKEAKGVLFVYRRNIAGQGSVSVLRGLAGSEEKFNILANRLLSLPEVTIAGVQETLQSFFMSEENEGSPVGYVLKQQSSKTGEVDPETGKPVYMKDNRYEVDTFFEPTEAALKRYKKSAASSNGKMYMTYELD